MTGYSREEVVGRNCRFLQGPLTDRDTVARIREAVSAGSEITVKLVNYKKDGTKFWNLFHLAPVHDIQVRSSLGALRILSVFRRMNTACELRRVESFGSLGARQTSPVIWRCACRIFRAEPANLDLFSLGGCSPRSEAAQRRPHHPRW